MRSGETVDGRARLEQVVFVFEREAHEDGYPVLEVQTRHLALPHSGWPTILKLTFWVCGTNPPSLEQKRTRALPVGQTESD